LHNVNSDELKLKLLSISKELVDLLEEKQPEAHGKHTVPKLVGVK